MKRMATRTAKRVRPGKTSTRGPKYVYFFAAGKAEGSSALRHLLGGKGCELAEMTNLGVPVPPGFTITTEAWAAYHAAGGKHPPGLWSQVVANLARLEGVVGQSAGPCRAAAPRLRPLGRARLHARHDGHRPQPRPQRPDGRGARALDQERALRLGLLPALPHDLWRRRARHRAPGLRRAAGARQGQGRGEDDADVPAPVLRELVAEFKHLVQARTGQPFPQDPMEQLRLAINAVFDSWFAKKAVDYRRIHRLPDDWGTAVTVDGHGLRQPRRDVGHRRLLLARSVDRRAALLRRVPRQCAGRGRRRGHPHAGAARRPQASACRPSTSASSASRTALERHYRDMQDIEFTVQEGRLYILQTRSGKRTAARGGAHRRRDGRARACSTTRRSSPAQRADKARQTALLRVEPASLHQLLVKTVDPDRHVHVDRARAARHARRRRGQGGLRPGEGGGDGAARGAGDPRARGDVARGRGRHARARRGS